MRMRKPRRISLNAFKPTCDLQPYLQTQQLGLSPFQNSMMLMFLMKRHQKLIFQNKQHQIQSTMDQLTEQNALLRRIKQKNTEVKSKKVLQSSFKVLEQLDLNRKHAYQVLDQQNKQISDRIYALETALQRMSSSQKSPALNEQYLLKLQQRVKDRVKKSERLGKIIEELQQKNDRKLQNSKKVLMSKIRQKLGIKAQMNKSKQQKKKSKSVLSFNSQFQSRSEQLLDSIFFRLEE